MSIILDLIVIIIVALTMCAVIKKGFVKTVLDFASVICAVIVAKIFAPEISLAFYNGLYDAFSLKIKEGVRAMIAENGLPEALEVENLSAFLEKYNSKLLERVSGELIESTVNIITKHLVALLSYGLAFMLVFVAVIIVFKVVSALLNGVFKLPILNQINKTLAVFLSVIIAFIYVLLFVAFMQIMMPLLSSVYPGLFGESVIENSFIFNYIYTFEWVEILV